MIPLIIQHELFVAFSQLFAGTDVKHSSNLWSKPLHLWLWTKSGNDAQSEGKKAFPKWDHCRHTNRKGCANTESSRSALCTTVIHCYPWKNTIIQLLDPSAIEHPCMRGEYHLNWISHHSATLAHYHKCLKQIDHFIFQIFLYSPITLVIYLACQWYLSHTL